MKTALLYLMIFFSFNLSLLEIQSYNTVDRLSLPKLSKALRKKYAEFAMLVPQQPPSYLPYTFSATSPPSPFQVLELSQCILFNLPDSDEGCERPGLFG